MSIVDQELHVMILQFLNENNFKDTMHELEKKTGVFFSMEYFKEQLLEGNLDTVDEYLQGFTKVNQTQQSIKLFFEIRKQKLLEALDKLDFSKAKNILKKDLEFIKTYNEDLFKDLTQLMTLDNFRQHENLTGYKDIQSARARLADSLKTLIESTPLFKKKLQFPVLNDSCLLTRVKQSLSWQCSQNENRSPYPFQGSILDNHSHGGVPLSHPHQPLQHGRPLGFSPYAKGMNYTLRTPDAGFATRTQSGLPYESAKILMPTEIRQPAQCRSLRIPDKTRLKMLRLSYSHSGNSILALTSSGLHLLWKWTKNEENPDGTVTTSFPPVLHDPRNGFQMVNDVTGVNPEKVSHCFCLSNNDAFLISSSGGKMSLFHVAKVETLANYMPGPPAISSLLFYHENNNIIVMGKEDSKITIFDSYAEKQIVKEIEGHNCSKITGLAFSSLLNVLVSSDNSSQLCVWAWGSWGKQKSTFLLPAARRTISDTRVQFKKDKVHFLVGHQLQLAVYEATKLQCITQWVAESVPIADATLSCDSQLVYTIFKDATVCVFNAENFQPQYRIAPHAYLTVNMSGLSIAAHPTNPNQFAVGLTNGGIYVIEPLESETQWGVARKTK